MKRKEEKTKKKINSKSKKGITLIALVITIVVLLILAGVSIAMLTGNNGILTQANNAKIEQSHSAVEEGIKLAYNEWKIEINTSSTAKLASTETVTIKGEEEKAEANTTVTFLDFLKDKKYIKENTENIMDVEKLTGSKQALGNGTTTDIYTITEESGVYVLNYIDEETTPLEIWSTENENYKPSLGKLADVVKVGDYVNYAPSYENVSPLKDGLGNGWRVAYVENGVVTLISEGVPLQTKLSNSSGSGDKTEQINIDWENVNKLIDKKVADNIEIPEIKHIQKICNQAGCTMTHIASNNDTYQEEKYTIQNDEIDIISIGTSYVLNNMSGINEYNEQAYFYFSDNINAFTTDNYVGTIDLRVVVDLKANLDYFGGTGSQSDPYQIY